MPDTSGSVDLGSLSTEEQEAVAALADANPEDANNKAADDRVPVDVAALIVLTREGEVQILEPGTPVNPDRAPTADLLHGMLGTAQKDLAGQEIAHAVVQMQMMQARAVQEQMAQAKIQQQFQKEPIR